MKNIIWALLLLFASCLLGYIAYQEYQRETKLAETSPEVDGEVIDNIKSGKFYYPVVAYTHKALSYKEHASNSGSNPPSYSAGDKVTLYLNSDNPSDIEIKSFFNQMGKPLILLFFSIMSFLASVRLFQFKKYKME